MIFGLRVQRESRHNHYYLPTRAVAYPHPTIAFSTWQLLAACADTAAANTIATKVAALKLSLLLSTQ